MLFGEANQIVDADFLAVFGAHAAGVFAKHLVHFAEDHPQVRLRDALFERREGQSRRPSPSVKRQGFM